MIQVVSWPTTRFAVLSDQAHALVCASHQYIVPPKRIFLNVRLELVADIDRNIERISPRIERLAVLGALRTKHLPIRFRGEAYSGIATRVFPQVAKKIKEAQTILIPPSQRILCDIAIRVQPSV
jgi:hypothetical protein